MHFEAVGYPRMTEPADAFWNAVSLVRNARSIAVPILLQLSDDEAMSALPTFTALREVDGAIDMFVFPDERHVKWQPAHRLAMYRAVTRLVRLLAPGPALFRGRAEAVQQLLGR
jgi:hypothetical protein